MAAVSPNALALKWVVDKSHKGNALFSIPNKFVLHTEIYTNAFPTITLHRRHIPHVLNPINMSLDTRQGVIRRTANYHPNLWDDDLIQSLPKPYEDPSYAERAERLIRDIKEVFSSMPTPHDINSSSRDNRLNLFEQISMVDHVQRLGIDRHFRTEIQQTLDHVYRCWNKMTVEFYIDGPVDLNTTALAFRILRLDGYDVSSEVLGRFKQANGDFLCSKSYADMEIKTILSLYRASLIAFPGEKVLDEAKAFAANYLEGALQKLGSDCNLSREIVFNLEYSWPTIIPRLEARTYIDIYQEEYSAINTKNTKTLLDLAKLDFNMIQSLQQAELQLVSRWWAESGFSKLEFARHRHVECYFAAAGFSVDPKHSFFRIGFAKISALVTYIDDIYDVYGTLDELKLFADTVKKWDPFAIDDLPEYMKIAFKGFYNTVNEIAREVGKNQGSYTLDYARKAWEAFIESQMKEAEWIYSGYMPTFQEHVENGKVSAGSSVHTISIFLTLEAPIPVDYPSRFDELLYTIQRLRGDAKGYKHEAASGEKVSCVTCYMQEHPGSTEEDALSYLNDVIDELIKELNWEYLKPGSIRTASKNYAHSITRSFLVFYKERDGYYNAKEDSRRHVLKTIIEPVPM